MSDKQLPPGMNGVLDNSPASDDVPEGKRRCARCGQVKDDTAFPEGRVKHLCFQCMGGNTQALPGMPRVKPVDKTITCPNCKADFDITADMYESLGQCESCNSMFFIDLPDNDA